VRQSRVNVVHGTVKKVDKGTKTVVVKTADGTEHTIKVTGETTYSGRKKGFDGLKEGTEVVVRATGKGTEETGSGNRQNRQGRRKFHQGHDRDHSFCALIHLHVKAADGRPPAMRWRAR
jgi:hypothetical protein